MSQNINQLFTTNPASSMVSSDLYYLGRSPYGVMDDFAITWANVMSSITVVGTITIGTWNGSVISGPYGGTGIDNGASTCTYGGNVSFIGAFTFAGNLTANTAITFPTSGTLATTSQLPTLPLSLADGGTGSNLTTVDNAIFQTNGSGVTILSTSFPAGLSPFTTIDQTSNSATLAINTIYITDNGAALVTYTLPVTAALGSIIKIIGKSSGGWMIVEGTGQSMILGTSTTTTTTGNLASTNTTDCIELICTTANTVFTVSSSVGNITVV